MHMDIKFKSSQLIVIQRNENFNLYC